MKKVNKKMVAPTKQDHEQAVDDMMVRLELPDSDRYYVRVMLIGSYHLGREDAKSEMIEAIGKS